MRAGSVDLPGGRRGGGSVSKWEYRESKEPEEPIVEDIGES